MYSNGQYAQQYGQQGGPSQQQPYQRGQYSQSSGQSHSQQQQHYQQQQYQQQSHPTPAYTPSSSAGGIGTSHSYAAPSYSFSSLDTASISSASNIRSDGGGGGGGGGGGSRRTDSAGTSFNFDQAQIMNQLNFYLSPRQRLDTLFAIHAACSLFIGVVGYVFPSAGSLFFLTESRREEGVARVLIRLYCCLIAAQGIMIWRARNINEGEIKRAFVQAYFLCFLFSTFAVIYEHMSNMGVVSGKMFGILKIVVMIALTLGYAWFTFFQPPSVFHGLGESFEKRY